MTPPLDLAAIEERCNAAKNRADPIKHYGLWRAITDALADIPVLIARVRELESERDALKAENIRISAILDNIMSSGPDKMIAEAVAAEREACAKMADGLVSLLEAMIDLVARERCIDTAKDIAAAIRARGEKETG